MNSVLIIVESFEQWAPYCTTESVITAFDYLENGSFASQPNLVINLCSDFGYHSEGYYCSLLGQARKHKVIPSIETLNRLQNIQYRRVDLSLLKPEDERLGGLDNEAETITFDIYFGRCEIEGFAKFGRFLFDQYPAPILRVILDRNKRWQLVDMRALSLQDLSESQQDLFADSLDLFSRKIWRRRRTKKPAQYDLAIFHDPQEPFPPSNRTALNLFLREAKKMQINAELITEEDRARLLEFDALFLRQTTAVNHITFSLAQQAEQADMVVIDDPSSIIRCTNKVYLNELLDNSHIPTPGSRLLFREKKSSYEELSENLGSRMVIKIPDGSFSIGVRLVEDEEQFNVITDRLFKTTAILLVQEFLPTEFDWRIGVLDGDCIFACKYYMARGHWQIYHHKSDSRTISGKVETVPVHTVPRTVLRTAVKATRSIGKGLYGVDIKLVNDMPLVIEVNDNPSIDHGIEDKILGNELYRIILREFTRRHNHRHS